eukprot:GILI01010196.1.p1 GENE.GILI01010196.1~~GILI01010196.1.p1  ORF type:complete len:349 (-),score=50.14 GILI01010196.1:159-1205(-)
MKVATLSVGSAIAGSWSMLRNMQLPVGPSRKHWGPSVFGHRGCRHIEGIPENTLKAFEYAMSQGAMGIECDVRLTRDDHIVVFHDPVLGRVMKDIPDPTVEVGQLDLVDLRQMSYATDKTNEVRIPTLEETICFCKDNNLKLIIDLKELKRQKVCIDKLLKLYKDYGYYLYTESMVIAFDPRLLYKLRKADHKIAVGMLHSDRMFQNVMNMPFERHLVPKWIQCMPKAVDRGLNFINTKIAPWLIGVSSMCPNAHDSYNAEYAKLWHKRGMSVYLWGFNAAEECITDMRREGIFVSADDKYTDFHPAKKEVTYESLFPDAPSNFQKQLGVTPTPPPAAHISSGKEKSH